MKKLTRSLLLICLTFFALSVNGQQSISTCFTPYQTGDDFEINYSCPAPPPDNNCQCDLTIGTPVLKMSFVPNFNPITNSTNYPSGLTFQYSVTDALNRTIYSGSSADLGQNIPASQSSTGNLTFHFRNVVFTGNQSLGESDFSIIITTPFSYTQDDGTGTIVTDESGVVTCADATYTMGLYTVNLSTTTLNTCLNSTSGSFVASGVPAGLPVSYYWEQTGPTGTLFPSTSTFVPPTSSLGTISYMFWWQPTAVGGVFDHGCLSPTTYLTVNVGNNPTLNISPGTVETICSGQSASFQFSGSDSYNITSNGSTTTNNGSFNPSPTVNTVYTVKGKNNVCPSETSPINITVNVNPAINFNISSTSTYFCPNTAPVTLTASSPGNNYTFVWTTNTGTNVGTGTSIQVSPVNTTTYNCSVTANGCVETKTLTITIPQGATPAAINVPYGYQCDNGYIQYFNAVDPNQGYTWSTNPGSGAVISQVYNGITNQYIAVDFSHSTADVTLYLNTVSTTYGCPSSTSIIIYQCCVPPPILSHTHDYISISNPLVNNGNTLATNAYYTNTPGKTTTYYVSGQLRLSGNSTIDGTTFIMNPGSSILVDGALTINNSHIYACSDMWNGIKLYDFSGAASTLNITNSLIEDAEYAVNAGYSNLVPPQNYPSTPSFLPVINLNNAWFNRCAVGVMADYDLLHPDSAYNLSVASHGVQIPLGGAIITANNCVFSCLNGITMTRVTNQNYNTTALSLGKLHNYRYNPNFYTFCGIMANGTSLFDVNGNQGVIQNCYFDNLVDGIVTLSDNISGITPGSNLNISNCNFQRAHLDPASENYNLIINYAYKSNPTGGTYYYPYYLPTMGYPSAAPILVGAGINFLGSQLNVGGASAAAGCTFSASDYGIIALPDGNGPVNISYNSFVKANATTYAYSTKNSGVYLSDQNNYNYALTYNINSNTFKDHYKQGITANMIGGGLNSVLNVNNNNFTATANFTAANNFSTNFGMAPEAISLTGYAPSAYLAADQYVISYNNIANYELGITAYNAYGGNINNNTINLFDDAANYTHGISAINCTKAQISTNVIKASTSGPWQYGQYGIFTQNSGGSIINCNTINGPDISLKCQGPNNTTLIEGNSFLNAAINNFEMSYTGFVGQQGTATHTNGNTFTGNQSAFWVDSGTPGNQSPFYYRNTGNQIPVGSNFDGSIGASIIPLGSPYAVSKNTAYYTCAFLKTNPILNPVTARKIATDSLHVSLYDTTAVFGNKHDLYRALIDTGAAYYNADAALSGFMASMAGSAQEKLLITDTLLKSAGRDTAKINQAIVVNNSFVPAGKHDAYLQKANNLYAVFKKGKKHFTAAQLQSLKNIAVLCPFEYGEGVYKARALMTLFDTTKYSNSCEQSSLTQPAVGNRVAASVEDVIIAEQNIKVYPNPAQNQLFIDGVKLQGSDNAEVQIYSTLGQLVLKSKLNTDITPISISSLADGSYFYKVIQNGNVILTDKLIILK